MVWTQTTWEEIAGMWVKTASVALPCLCELWGLIPVILVLFQMHYILLFLIIRKLSQLSNCDKLHIWLLLSIKKKHIVSLLSNWPIKDFIINMHGMCTRKFDALQGRWSLLAFVKIFFPIIHTMYLHLSIILGSQCQRNNDLHYQVREKKRSDGRIDFSMFIVFN